MFSLKHFLWKKLSPVLAGRSTPSNILTLLFLIKGKKQGAMEAARFSILKKNNWSLNNIQRNLKSWKKFLDKTSDLGLFWETWCKCLETKHFKGKKFYKQKFLETNILVLFLWQEVRVLTVTSEVPQQVLQCSKSEWNFEHLSDRFTLCKSISTKH